MASCSHWGSSQSASYGFPRSPSLHLAQRAARRSDTVARVILVVAATQDELGGSDGAATLVCGVGPVEAAARTAAALAERQPRRRAARRDRRRAGRSTRRSSSSAPKPSTATRTTRAGSRCACRPIARLVDAARRALPERARRADRHLGARRRVAAAARSRRWRATRVLRAAALARRARARGARALERGRRARPRRLAVRRGEGRARRRAAGAARGDRSCAELPPPLPPAERTVGQVVAETIRAYGDSFWRVAAARAAARGRRPAERRVTRRRCRCSCFWAATPLFVAAYL